jgi:hypothetical protein
MYRMILSTVLIAASLGFTPATQADEDYDLLIERLSRQLDMDGELALRIMAQGLRNADYGSSSERAANLSADDVICTFVKPTGERFTNIQCRQYRYHSDNALMGSNSERGATAGMTTGHNLFQYRIRERQARDAIAQLPGLPSMNDRLVAEGIRGLPLPQGLPSQAELDQFIRAYRRVNELDRQYEPMLATATGSALNELRREADDAMVQAIQESGLNWQRYNEITEHVATHAELFEYVRANYRAGG